MEFAPATGKPVLVEISGARMITVRARPLQTQMIYAIVSDATVRRRHHRDLCHDIGARRILHGIAQSPRKITDDLPVWPGVTDWVDCSAYALHAPFRVGKGTIFLCEAHPGQHDLGEFSCLGHEYVLHREEFEVVQFLLDLVSVRVGK